MTSLFTENMTLLVTDYRGMRECELATIGNGLTDAQALTFYNIAQKFETALSR
jgi:hypothetical protein